MGYENEGNANTWRQVKLCKKCKHWGRWGLGKNVGFALKYPLRALVPKGAGTESAVVCTKFIIITT
jgi:hypothetical protein